MRTYVRYVQQDRDDDHVFEACNRSIYEQGWCPSVTVGPITSHDYSSVPHVIGSAESTICPVLFPGASVILPATAATPRSAFSSGTAAHFNSLGLDSTVRLIQHHDCFIDSQSRRSTVQMR